MVTRMTLALGLAAAVLAVGAAPGAAAERQGKATLVASGAFQPTNGRGYHRKRPAVVRLHHGRRIGFYSYSYRDVINTYGMSRSLYGSINTYRDPFVDRQTAAGPFDHGFFFDSAIAPRGGDAPYLR
jgi:hypothetical protein